MNSLQVFISEATAEAVDAVAILAFELDKRLAVGGCADLQSACLPLPQDEVVLGRQFLQKPDGTHADVFVADVTPVGKELRHHRVDDEQTAAGCCGSFYRQTLLQLLNVLRLQEFAHLRFAIMIKLCYLQDTDEGEVLGACAEETPITALHRFSQAELVLEEGKLLLEPLNLFLIFHHLDFLYEACHSQEKRLYLEKVVAMLACGLQGNPHGPSFEGITIQTKAEATT